MKRDLEKYLIEWKSLPHRLPLLLRGARQVGKSFTIESFGKKYFENLVAVNFELHPELHVYFKTLQPQEILKGLSLSLNQPIIPGKTLLFLDEIQECPQAIQALRYFKEQLPELHIIGAGSLLEFILNDHNFRMPVGRIQFLYLKPLSFKEYLSASGYEHLRTFLEETTLQNLIPEPVHQQLLKLVHEYMVLGGMPGVLNTYFSEKNFINAQRMQTVLLNTYRNDFGKYAKTSDHQYLRRLFEKAPGLIAQHFKYAHVDPDVRAREIKAAFAMLQNAGLIYPVYASSAAGLPLISVANEKKYKLLFLDIGLVTRAAQIDINLLLTKDVMLINQGALVEQFVGQELMAYADPFEEYQLFFWHRENKGSQAQVDFITPVGSQIVPLEVKSGSTGRLKSLQILLAERTLPLGIKISQSPLQWKKPILSLPLYMVGELSRWVKMMSQYT